MNAASDTGKHTNILIIGSSRALVHLDTRIIDSVTGWHSYNYGLNAVTIKTCFNVSKYALHYQKKAKLVILNIDYNMFDISIDPYKDPYYYPFEKKLQGFLMTDSTTKRDIHRLHLFDISLYDDFVKYAAIDGLIRPGRKVEGVYNGYYPHQNLTDFIEPAEELMKKGEINIAESGISILHDIVELCKERNVKLAFVTVPYYKNTSLVIIINWKKGFPGIAKQNGILFLDCTALPIITDKTYFYNGNHLNARGAAVYTTIVADTIKNICNPIKTMKILHVLYSGLGGHGNIFFSMVSANASHEFEYEALFYGIEDVRPDFIEQCENNIFAGIFRKSILSSTCNIIYVSCSSSGRVTPT
ncbi:MAG: hypothetical protein IPL50_11770 [Chitinophagaceae bacterium]|nr:hypothetical protein [Chitinophagaceae bacterium]